MEQIGGTFAENGRKLSELGEEGTEWRLLRHRNLPEVRERGRRANHGDGEITLKRMTRIGKRDKIELTRKREEHETHVRDGSREEAENIARSRDKTDVVRYVA